MAEGFRSKAEFLMAWCSMYDKPAASAHPDNTWLDQPITTQINNWLIWLFSRPDERYDAWVLEFELVKGDQK